MTASQVSWSAALWGSLWADNPVLGRVIILVTLGLALTALRAVWIHRRRYQRETAILAALAERLHQLLDGPPSSEPPAEPAAAAATSGDGAPNAAASAPLIDVATLKEEVPSDSLVWERLSSIQALRSRRVRVDVGILQELSAAREQSRPGLELPGFAAGLCMLLGVFGTFVGLAVMVQQIHLGLPSATDGVTLDSWNDSIGNLRTVLGGMKSAFSTSVIGMGCAIACMVADARLRHVRTAFMERFERCTVEDLLPATVPATEDENLLERVTFQLEEAFERLESIYEQNQSALADLAGVEEACAQIVTEVRAVTRTEAARDLHGVVEQLTATNRAILDVVEQLPRLVAATERTGRELVGQVAETLRSSTTPAASALPGPSLLRLMVGGAVVIAVVLGLLEILE